MSPLRNRLRDAPAGEPGAATLVAMIDLHTHLLPGIDDGPDSMDESVRMAAAAWDAGVRTMVCTPHMIAHYPTDPAEVHAAVDDLRAALREADVPLTVVPGGEIAIDHIARLDDEQLRRRQIVGGDLDQEVYPAVALLLVSDADVRPRGQQ